MYCVYLGKAVQTVNPPAGSVGTSQLASTAVTPAKMDLSQDYTFTGKISGQNYPVFFAGVETAQSLSNDSATKMQFNYEDFDTDSAYDPSTNYRFTVPSGKGGKYYFFINAYYLSSGQGNLNYVSTNLYKNGSKWQHNNNDFRSNPIYNFCDQISGVIDLNAGDYLEGYSYVNGTSVVLQNSNGSPNRMSIFTAYRIGD
jgi:hypothetical protein